MKKKIGGSMILVLAVLCLTACQAKEGANKFLI